MNSSQFPRTLSHTRIASLVYDNAPSYMEYDEQTGSRIWASDGPMSRWTQEERELHVISEVYWFGLSEYYKEQTLLATVHELIAQHNSSIIPTEIELDSFLAKLNRKRAKKGLAKLPTTA